MALFFGTLNVLLFFVFVITTFPPETFFKIVVAVSSGVLVPQPMFRVIFSIFISRIPILLTDTYNRLAVPYNKNIFDWNYELFFACAHYNSS